MTAADFKKFPELLSRAQVIDCGIPAQSIDLLRVHLQADGQAVPYGSIGAVRLPSRQCKNTKAAKFKYRKTDVARILGYKIE
jgi:hypothetical protein